MTVPAGRRVASGVRKEVREDLRQLVGVCPRRQPVGKVHDESQSGAFEGRPGEIERLPDRRHKVEVLAHERAACVTFGKRIERTREADEPLGLLPERLVCRPIRRDDTVPKGLEVALQVRQRRSKLVRRVRDEVAPHHLLAFEAGGHLVERIGEAGDLFGTFAWDAGCVVALGDPPGCATDLGQGPCEHPGEDDREHDARDRGDDDRADHHPGDRVVVHLLGVVGRRSGLDHQRAKDLGADDGDTHGKDRQPECRRGESGDRDPRSDAATEPAPEAALCAGRSVGHARAAR